MANSLILNSLEIQNFRLFRHLRIERLGRVNLIVGQNNIGKTCLLEALCADFYPQLIKRLALTPPTPLSQPWEGGEDCSKSV